MLLAGRQKGVLSIYRFVEGGERFRRSEFRAVHRERKPRSPDSDPQATSYLHGLRVDVHPDPTDVGKVLIG